MIWLNKAELAKDLIQTKVDETVQTVEEVHKAIAEVPFQWLSTHTAAQAAARRRHDRAVSSVYTAIRSVNHSIGAMASNVFEAAEDARVIADRLQRADAEAPSRKAPTFEQGPLS